MGLDLDWLTASQAREREPHLKPGIAAAVWSPRDHQVENRLLGRALARHGKPGSNWSNIARCARSRSRAAAPPGRDRARRDPADIVVLAAGAWSREVGGIPPAHLPPVRPIKGQMMALQMDPAAPLLRHVLWLPRGYLVPRNDGRLMIGATVEERGFDERLTAGGMFALLEGAWRAVPTIEELPIAEIWVGFRPGFARRCADAGSKRHRPAGRRDRPSPQRHSVDPGHGRRGQLLYPERPASRHCPALLARALLRLAVEAMDVAAQDQGQMTRLRINGEETEIAVDHVAELIAERGIDPSARFLAVAVNGDGGATRRMAESVARRRRSASRSSGPLQGG